MTLFLRQHFLIVHLICRKPVITLAKRYTGFGSSKITQTSDRLLKHIMAEVFKKKPCPVIMPIKHFSLTRFALSKENNLLQYFPLKSKLNLDKRKIEPNNNMIYNVNFCEKLNTIDYLCANKVIFDTLISHKEVNQSNLIYNNISSICLALFDNTRIKTNLSSVNTTQYLPLSFTKKEILSGLLNLNPIEKTLMKDPSPLGDEFRTFMHVLITKVLFHLNKKFYPTLEIYLQTGLKATFGSIKSIVLSKELGKVVIGREITYLQHILTFVFGYKTFSYELLESICGPYVICDSYKATTINILTFIELMNLKEFQQLIFKHTKIAHIYHLINPDGFDDMKTFFNPVESIIQTHQRNADLMIPINNKENHSFNLYYDIKSYLSGSINKQRFALFHLHEKTLLNYYNDITTSLNQMIKKHNLPKTHPVAQLYKNIKDYFNPKSAHGAKEDKLRFLLDRHHHLLKQCVLFMEKNSDSSLYLGLGTEAIEDKLFDTQGYHEIKDNIEKYKLDAQKLDHIFTNNSILDKANQKKNIEQMVEDYFSEPMKKEIRDTLSDLIFISIGS